VEDTHATAGIQPRRSHARRLLLLPLHLFGLLGWGLLLALTLQRLAALLFWPRQGWQLANALTQQELAAIQAGFPRSLLFADPARSAERLDETLQYWLFQRSGLNTRRHSQHPLASAPKHPLIYTDTAPVYPNTAAHTQKQPLLHIHSATSGSILIRPATGAPTPCSPPPRLAW